MFILAFQLASWLEHNISTIRYKSAQSFILTVLALGLLSDRKSRAKTPQNGVAQGLTFVVKRWSVSAKNKSNFPSPVQSNFAAAAPTLCEQFTFRRGKPIG